MSLYGISVQNEPDLANDWTKWTPGEIVRLLRENAGRRRRPAAVRLVAVLVFA